MKFTTDFFTETYAGFIALYPNSAAAEAWIDANVPPEALTAAGGIAVKPEYLADALAEIRAEGLTVGTVRQAHPEVPSENILDDWRRNK
jgi:hypothetical protein